MYKELVVVMGKWENVNFKNIILNVIKNTQIKTNFVSETTKQ